jgi:hypothetical protein
MIGLKNKSLFLSEGKQPEVLSETKSPPNTEGKILDLERKAKAVTDDYGRQLVLAAVRREIRAAQREVGAHGNEGGPGTAFGDTVRLKAIEKSLLSRSF